MQISNRINSINFAVQNNDKTIEKNKIAFKGNEVTPSSEALDSFGKAKLAMDGQYTKPIPYSEKIKILKEKGVKEEDFKKFLSFTDAAFIKAVDLFNSGISIDIINKIIHKDGGYTENGENIAKLIQNNSSYMQAQLICDYGKSIPEDTFKKVLDTDLDFDENKIFKVETKHMKELLSDKSKCLDFLNVVNFGIDPNIALHACKNNDIEKIKEKINTKNELNNNTKLAYLLKNISDDDVKKLIEISKKYNIDFNDYEQWFSLYDRHTVNGVDEYLKMGLSVDDLDIYISLPDEELKKAISFAKQNNIQAKGVIEIKQSVLDGDKEANALNLLAKNGISVNNAYRLAHFDEAAQKEALSYLSQGIDIETSLRLSRIKESDELKKEAIKYLDVFKNPDDAISFLKLNLSKEDKEKFLDLTKRGATFPLANYCLKSETVYKEAINLSDSKICDLTNLYAPYSDEEFLYQAKLIRLGVPKDSVSIYSCTLKPEQVKLMEEGVKFSDLASIEETEEKGTDCTIIKNLLKKGIKFEDAAIAQNSFIRHFLPNDMDLYSLNYMKEENPDLANELTAEATEKALCVLNKIEKHIRPNMFTTTILHLATLQEKRGDNWAKEEDKESIVNFMEKMESFNYDHFEDFLDAGFLNEKAFKNFKELENRGVDYFDFDNMVLLSQLEYKTPEQYDRVAELLKAETPFLDILSSMNDDKSFIKTLNEPTDSFLSPIEPITTRIALIQAEKLGCSLDDLNYIFKHCQYNNKNDLDEMIEYLKMGHTVQDAVKISNHSIYMKMDSEKDEKIKKERKQISKLILQGCSYDYLSEIGTKKKLDLVEEHISEGIDPYVAEKLVALNISKENKKAINTIMEIKNSTVAQDLKKDSGNPILYPYIEELFDIKNCAPHTLRQILESNLSIKDIYQSGKIFIKSPLKQAMKRPNLYLSGIPIEDTEKVNGQYPKLTDKKLKKYQKEMIDFFKSTFVQSMRALKYLDVDTYNQMMDKRTSSFEQQLKTLNDMDNNHYELVSKITRCRKDNGKLLSSKEKIDLSKIVLYHQLGYLDIDYLEEMVKDGKVNVEKLNQTIFEKLMIDTIGLTPEELAQNKDGLDFDEENMFLLLRTQASADFLSVKEIIENEQNLYNAILELEDLLNNSPEQLAHFGYTPNSCRAFIDLLKKARSMEEKDLYREFVKISPFANVGISPQEIAKDAILHDYKEYITDKTTKFGKINAKTKEKFKNLNLDYDKWLNYSKKSEIEFNGHKFKIGLWDRYPQKDLFMGNRTSCCTAIIEGANGKATPIYLSNTAFNVIQLKDENGNIIAMSRVFVGEIDKEPSMIIENIEINSAFLKNKSEEEKNLLRDKMFEYIKDFGREVSKNKEMKTYFSTNYTNVPLNDLNEVEKNIDFVGNLSCESIYLNCKPGWCEPEKLKDAPCKLYEIP